MNENSKLKIISVDIAKKKENEYDLFEQCEKRYNKDIKVFIINGSGGSGKDTFCNYIKQLAFEKDRFYFVDSIYTSTPAKQWAKKMGWDGSKLPMDRRFLSDIKDMLDYWDNATYYHIQEQFNNYYSNRYSISYSKTMFFIHAREPKDIIWIKSFCSNKEISCKTILIKRPNFSKKGNHADDNVEQYTEYDYTIINDGTLEEFKKKAQDFFKYDIEKEYSNNIYTASNDSEVVAKVMENLEYHAEKKEEILAKYEVLLDKYNALVKEKNELKIKCQANYEKQKREEKERLEQAKRAYENMPQWKKETLNNWTEDLKESCKQYWEDREY